MIEDDLSKSTFSAQAKLASRIILFASNNRTDTHNYSAFCLTHKVKEVTVSSRAEPASSPLTPFLQGRV